MAKDLCDLSLGKRLAKKPFKPVEYWNEKQFNLEILTIKMKRRIKFLKVSSVVYLLFQISNFLKYAFSIYCNQQLTNFRKLFGYGLEFMLLLHWS